MTRQKNRLATEINLKMNIRLLNDGVSLKFQLAAQRFSCLFFFPYPN